MMGLGGFLSIRCHSGGWCFSSYVLRLSGGPTVRAFSSSTVYQNSSSSCYQQEIEQSLITVLACDNLAVNISKSSTYTRTT